MGDLENIGRSLDLPRGFGGRVQTMMTLFRSASQFESGDILINALTKNAQSYQIAYGGLQGLPDYVLIWQERLAKTIQMLKQMEGEIRDQRLEIK